MAARGRKRKPSQTKALAGNPGKRPLPEDEPQYPIPEYGDPPAWMNDMAKATWREFAPEIIEQKLYTVVDRAAFEAFCIIYSRWREAVADLDKIGSTVQIAKSGYAAPVPEVAIERQYADDLRKWCVEFGFTPSSRSRVSKGKGEGDKPPQNPQAPVGSGKGGTKFRPADLLGEA